jgi:chromate transporter
LTAALLAVTATVVGVVLNLAVWFGLRVIFPSAQTIDWFAILVATISFAGMSTCKWGTIRVVLGAELLGLLHRALT